MELFDSPVQPTVPSTVVVIPEQSTITRITGLTADEVISEAINIVQKY